MYKVIYDNKVIDVIKHPDFIRFLQTGHIAFTDKTSAHGILGSDRKTIYAFAPQQNRDLQIVSIEKVSNEEFSRLSCLLNSGQSVCADETALTKAKNERLAVLSSICKTKIASGFTVRLSDGERYNFRLTAEDQLNLIGIENQLAAGETFFVYHATNEPCRVYTPEDMLTIVKAFRHHILYHTTYFNAAKQYIKSLTDIDKVNLFRYGMDVSSFIDPALRHIVKNGGVS